MVMEPQDEFTALGCRYLRIGAVQERDQSRRQFDLFYVYVVIARKASILLFASVDSQCN